MSREHVPFQVRRLVQVSGLNRVLSCSSLSSRLFMETNGLVPWPTNAKW